MLKRGIAFIVALTLSSVLLLPHMTGANANANAIAVNAEDWTEFTSHVFGMSFDYPVGWTVDAMSSKRLRRVAPPWTACTVPRCLGKRAVNCSMFRLSFRFNREFFSLIIAQDRNRDYDLDQVLLPFFGQWSPRILRMAATAWR